MRRDGRPEPWDGQTLFASVGRTFLSFECVAIVSKCLREFERLACTVRSRRSFRTRTKVDLLPPPRSIMSTVVPFAERPEGKTICLFGKPAEP